MIDADEILILTNELTEVIRVQGEEMSNLNRELSSQEILKFYQSLALAVEKIYRSGFVAGEKCGYTKLN
jgi:hypothetical protein